MVRHQCYDTNHFITVKCIYYRTLIVPNLIIKYDSLPSFSFAKIQPVHVRRRHFYTFIGHKTTDFIMRK